MTPVNPAHASTIPAPFTMSTDGFPRAGTSPLGIGVRRRLRALGVLALVGLLAGPVIAQAPPTAPAARPPAARPPAARPDQPARPAASPPARPGAPAAAPRQGTPVAQRVEGLRPRRPAPRVAFQGGPAIWFEVLDHDFELMTNAETRTTTFRFHNVGDSPLSIIDVVPACACTRPTFQKATYQPGESGVIEVAFTPPTGGHQAKSLQVLTNAKSPGEVVNIRVIGEVDAVLTFTPQSLDVGEVKRGEGAVKEFELVADAPATIFQSVALNARAQHVAASFVDAPGKREGKAIVKVSIDPAAPWGFFRTGVAEVEVTGKLDNGSPVSKKIPVRILATIVDDVRASTYIINFGQSHYGDEVKGETIITSTDGKAFEILDPKIVKLTSASRGVADFEGTVEVLPLNDPEKPDEKGYRLVVTGTVGAATGFVSGTLEFSTRMEGSDVAVKRSIGLNGRVDEPGRTFQMPQARPSAR